MILSVWSRWTTGGHSHAFPPHYTPALEFADLSTILNSCPWGVSIAKWAIGYFFKRWAIGQKGREPLIFRWHEIVLFRKLSYNHSDFCQCFDVLWKLLPNFKRNVTDGHFSSGQGLTYQICLVTNLHADSLSSCILFADFFSVSLLRDQPRLIEASRSSPGHLHQHRMRPPTSLLIGTFPIITTRRWHWCVFFYRYRRNLCCLELLENDLLFSFLTFCKKTRLVWFHCFFLAQLK